METQTNTFSKDYLGEPTQESIDKYNAAFDARLAYERNCIAKYDYPDNRPSKSPIFGERMIDYAYKFGTTVEEMKKVEGQVELFLEKEKSNK